MSQSHQVDDATLDNVYGALSDPYRRSVLQRLPAGGDSISLDALTDAVRSHVDDPRLDERELRMRLFHVHLPKLENMGLVERHDDSTVSLAPDAPTLANPGGDGLFDLTDGSSRHSQ